MIRPRAGQNQRILQALAFVSLVAALTGAFGGVAFAVGKVSANPPSPTIAEGGVQVVTFSLAEPIIASTPDPTVVITFTVHDPTSRVQLSEPSLTWAADNWFAPMFLTISSIPDGIHDASDTATIDISTTSASEFYNGFTTPIAVTLSDPDPTPTTATTAPITTSTTMGPAPSTTTTTADPSTTAAPTTVVQPATGELPQTGGNTGNGAAGAFLLIIVGASMAAVRAGRLGGSRQRRPH
jgi:hypothetical protein